MRGGAQHLGHRRGGRGDERFVDLANDVIQIARIERKHARERWRDQRTDGSCFDERAAQLGDAMGCATIAIRVLNLGHR